MIHRCTSFVRMWVSLVKFSYFQLLYHSYLKSFISYFYKIRIEDFTRHNLIYLDNIKKLLFGGLV